MPYLNRNKFLFRNIITIQKIVEAFVKSFEQETVGKLLSSFNDTIIFSLCIHIYKTNPPSIMTTIQLHITRIHVVITINEMLCVSGIVSRVVYIFCSCIVDCVSLEHCQQIICKQVVGSVRGPPNITSHASGLHESSPHCPKLIDGQRYDSLAVGIVMLIQCSRIF